MAESPVEILAKLNRQREQLLDYLLQRRTDLGEAVRNGNAQRVQAELDEYLHIADKLLLVHKTRKTLIEDQGA